MAAHRRRKLILETSIAFADAAASCLAFGLLLMMLTSSVREASSAAQPMRGSKFGGGHLPCDEIYVVGEGETLHTISDKCGDPYIVERNPHVNDPDDVYPGLVLQIIPSKLR